MTSRRWMLLACMLVASHGVVIPFDGACAQAAQLQGQVLLEGKIPPAVVVQAKSKKKGDSLEGCGELNKISPKLLVTAEGGVANVVVWLEEGQGPFPVGQASSTEEEIFLLDQRACVFDPHVLVVPLGGKFAIRNSDPVLHNIRIFDPAAQIPEMLMHEWQKVKARDIVWEFEKPGRYLVRCGVHLWMYAWVVVAPHSAYRVTDRQGVFQMTDVAPGPHTLHVWHETLGELEVPVEVTAEGTALDPIWFPPVRQERADAV